MTDENNTLAIPNDVQQALTQYGDDVAFPLDTKIIDWRELRDVIAPQGEFVTTESLVGETFAIYRAHPFPSAFGDSPKNVYWVVGRTEDGMLFNTTLGGQVIVPILDTFYRLNQFLASARMNGDTDRENELIAVGAGTAWRFTLQSKLSANGFSYYFFE
jgi:hypothetical protein